MSRDQGKTLILAFRAEYLARAATRPVLLLCYANGIAGRLEDAMQDRGVEDRVHVLTFHSWCYRMLRTYGIPIAVPERDYPNYQERLAASVSEVVKAVYQGHIPPEQYDAVLINEAHDFEPQWLALATKMVNPRTKALMVVYDDIQAVYKGRERPVSSRWDRSQRPNNGPEDQLSQYGANLVVRETLRRRRYWRAGHDGR